MFRKHPLVVWQSLNEEPTSMRPRHTNVETIIVRMLIAFVCTLVYVSNTTWILANVMQGGNYK